MRHQLTTDTPLYGLRLRLASRRFPAGCEVTVTGLVRGTACYVVRLTATTTEAYALPHELTPCPSAATPTA